MSPAQDGRIRVEGVWKRFRRGEIHDSLRDLLPALSRQLMRRNSVDQSLRAGEFWALRDLSFEALPGRALGIIGANGAGKSTALKILTQILRPTLGTVDVQGRVGALIEVSAGFHQDLTGRENIFLKGSIMGMPQELIRRRFDEIVEFSGIGEFLDTPVKRYSSGMNARLGFSIAAHLDPDVLIVDEVLAVGDFRFQDRAFGRIRDLVTSGIPVVIVSHQLDRILSLCSDVIVLDHGAVGFRGSASDAITWYLSGTRDNTISAAARSAIRLHSLSVDAGGAPIPSGERISLALDGTAEDPELMQKETVVLRVRSATSGQIVFSTNLGRFGLKLLNPGPFRIRISLEMNVRPGVFALEPYVTVAQSGKELTAGPIAYVQVQEDPGFIGTVQLKPRMMLENGLERG